MKQLRTLTSVLALGGLALSAMSANAMEVQFNGFGSVYGGKDFTNDVQSYDFGSSSKPQFSQYTLFGLNVGAHLMDNVDAAAQFVVSGSRQENVMIAPSSWNLFANWAFINYQTPVDGLRVKLGKQLIPNWMAAEYIYVRALQPYRALPQQVQGLNPLTSFDGLSLVQDINLGFGRINAQVFGGQGDGFATTSAFSINYQAQNMIGGALNFIGDGFKVHGAVVRQEVDTTAQAYAPISLAQITGIPTLPSIQGTIASNYKQNLRQENVGISIDKYNLVVWAEYTWLTSNDAPASGLGTGNIFQSGRGGYALVGYRIGKLMPRYMYSTADWSGMGLTGFDKIVQHNIGFNYNFSDQTVFKFDFQVDHIPDGATPAFATRQVGSTSQTGTGVTAGVDFLF